MARLKLDAGSGEFELWVGPGVIRELDSLVRGDAFVVQDASLAWAQSKWASLHVAGGEEAKTLGAVERLLAAFGAAGLERSATVVVVGGGSIGDMAGFAASIWMRGVRLIQVPTTLLAMVDSAVGGKTGINHAGLKNAIGTFWPATAVIADTDFLSTLPAPQLRSGMAEVVKYAVAVDPAVGQLLESAAPTAQLIEACLRAKAAVVAQDPRDGGRRAVLNYGHTAGHALEAASGYRLLHGEAVATGMRVAARISLELKLCAASTVATQDRWLSEHVGTVDLSGISSAQVLELLARDKKAVGKRPAWVLLRAVGWAEEGHSDVPAELVEEVISDILADA